MTADVEVAIAAEHAVVEVVRAARRGEADAALTPSAASRLLADNVHFAAGLAPCRDAGCTVTDLAGQPVDGGRGAVAAADPDTHAAVLAAVDRIRRAEAAGA